MINSEIDNYPFMKVIHQKEPIRSFVRVRRELAVVGCRFRNDSAEGRKRREQRLTKRGLSRPEVTAVSFHNVRITPAGLRITDVAL